ncbi:MAG: biliverdin-producing heme oxygenase [Leptospiraceae bacterium]|nr:biliverdin-producing heme oxygenase [Leptospiraceae bacterium]
MSNLEHIQKAIVADHRVLEREPAFAVLLSPRVTLSDYTVYLRLMHSFISAVEERLQEQLQAWPHLQGLYRPRQALLQAELASLGCSAESAADLDFIWIDEFSCLGLIYSLEGSANGGAALYGNLQRAGIQAPMRYFTELLPQPHWSRVAHAISAINCTALELQSMIAGAIAVFHNLQHLAKTYRSLTPELTHPVGQGPV